MKKALHLQFDCQLWNGVPGQLRGVEAGMKLLNDYIMKRPLIYLST